MKGIILHGGHGTRLRPLTHTGPKQLLPIANKPMSRYCLESITDAGIKEIAVIIGGVGSNKVRDYYGDGTNFGVKITYIEQNEPKGIAHAIRLCKNFVNGEKFLVFLGDNIIQKSISKIVKEFEISKKDEYDATVLLCEVDNPSRFGIAEMNNSKIIKIIEKPKNPPSNLAVTGIYLLTPKIFDVIDDLKPSWRNELEITDALDILLKINDNIGYEIITDYWKDTGTPEDIIHANGEILKKMKSNSEIEFSGTIIGKEPTVIGEHCDIDLDVTLVGPVIIGNECKIKSGAIIGPNVSIGNSTDISKCKIENSIVMNNCIINSNSKISNSIKFAMNNESLVSVVVLNYNAGNLLLDCVESLKRSTYTNLEILVVDNISSDGSQVRCKNKFPDIKLIQNEKNLGYCGGNNVGIKESKGEYIVILNPDTVIDPNCIRELISAHNEFGEGLYQPKILSLNEEGIIQSTGNMMHIFGFGYARDKGEKNTEENENIEKIGYASGTCLFSTRKILEKIGPLDEFLFLYHDDLDLGWRAAQIGINSYYVPKSKIFHVESYSLKWSSKKFYWLERNRKYCILTHYSKETYQKMRFSLFLVDLFVWGFYFSKGFLGAKIKAELDIKKHKKIIEMKYLELEKRKIISDIEIIRNFPDKIFVPINVSQQSMNQKFNSILTRLSKNVKEKLK